MGYCYIVKGGVQVIEVMSALLDNVISFLSSDVGLWLVGAVIFGFLLRLFIQFLLGLFK
jgi:hypothetical protein